MPLHVNFSRFLHLLQKFIVLNFDWSRPELLSLCWHRFTYLLGSLGCFANLPDHKISCLGHHATRVLHSTIITRAAVLTFQLLQAIIINQMRHWRVNVRYTLLMVGLNITNMQITLTPPGDHRTHDFLIQSRTLLPRHAITNGCAARVFVARGKRLCCRPCQSDRFCNQGIFQDFGHRGCEITFEVLSSSLPCYFLPSTLTSHPVILYPFPSPSLKVGPLNPARRSGEHPSRNWIFGVFSLQICLQQI